MEKAKRNARLLEAHLNVEKIAFKKNTRTNSFVIGELVVVAEENGWFMAFNDKSIFRNILVQVVRDICTMSNQGLLD